MNASGACAAVMNNSAGCAAAPNPPAAIAPNAGVAPGGQAQGRPNCQ
jgi:hypothetical protein